VLEKWRKEEEFKKGLCYGWRVFATAEFICEKSKLCGEDGRTENRTSHRKKVSRGKTKNFCTLSVESTSRLLLADGETANGMRSGSTNGVRTAKAKTDRTAARALTHATSRRQTHRILIKTRHMPCKHMLYVITLFAARLSGMLFRDC